jgi:hypothetical protein
MGSTYGTWLRGDARGWRARHRREHAEGDYRDPPPEGSYDELLERSRRLMKRKPVRLTPEQRRIACEAMGEALLRHEADIAELSMGAMHFHLVSRFVPVEADIRSPGIRIPGLQNIDALDDFEVHKRIARHFVGIGKRRSARALSDAGLVSRGGVWAVRGRCCRSEAARTR